MTTPPTRDDHVADDVPLLLTGEADRATVHRVGTHLRACTDCRDDLVQAVVAHATLRSAAGTSPAVATAGRHTDVSVGTRLREAADATPPGSDVDLSPVFAQIRAEAASASAPVAPAGDELAARRGRRTRRALLAAAAIVVIGGGTAVGVTAFGDDGRAVTVQAYGAGTVDASARVGDGWMRLDASDLPRLPSDQYYEAWLVNAEQTGVLPLGAIGGDGKASFSVPADVMSRYPTLQVTVQQDNGDPTPSSTSVLRASL